MRGSRRRLQVGAALRGAWGDSLVRNSAQLLLTTAGTSGLGYLYWVLAARLLPREAVGLGSALISAMGVCALLADLGLSSTCIQRLPHRRSGQEWNLTVSTSVVQSAVTGAGAGLLACALQPALSSSFRVLLDSPLALVLFVVGTAMSAAGNLVDHVFVAERASGGMTSRNLCFSLGKLLLLAVPVGAATAIHPLFASWVGSLAIALPLALV
ncbi:MAG: hypothetical protein JWR42_130, partial [Marmoricola sp.]|nr:hypothetical protein [Marmoricola sp.]